MYQRIVDTHEPLSTGNIFEDIVTSKNQLYGAEIYDSQGNPLDDAEINLGAPMPLAHSATLELRRTNAIIISQECDAIYKSSIICLEFEFVLLAADEPDPGEAIKKRVNKIMTENRNRYNSRYLLPHLPEDERNIQILLEKPIIFSREDLRAAVEKRRWKLGDIAKRDIRGRFYSFLTRTPGNWWIGLTPPEYQVFLLGKGKKFIFDEIAWRQGVENPDDLDVTTDQLLDVGKEVFPPYPWNLE